MKKIGLSIAALAAILIFVVPLFLPKTFQVERQVEIQAPLEMTFARVANLQTWNDWSPWLAKEPGAEVSFEGTPGVVGSQSTWKGEIIGSGRQTLQKIVQNEYLETQLEFFEPQSSTSTGYWKFSKKEDGCHVTWGINGTLSYPIERYIGLFFDSMIGGDFETGLNTLKSLLEDKN